MSLSLSLPIGKKIALSFAKGVAGLCPTGVSHVLAWAQATL